MPERSVRDQLGYRPTLRINLREDDEGGELRKAAAEEWDERHPIKQRELIVLIHGFNNNRRDASGAYSGFRHRQIGSSLDQQSIAGFENSLGDVFWPGDAKWPGILDAADFLVYPAVVANAVGSAPLLADYLRARKDCNKVHFIAHSLGARATLDTIKLLAAQPGSPRIGKLCLMAAAVPLAMVGPGGPLREAITHAESLLILYSPDDAVLSVAFPPGQTLAGTGEGFFPTAVGHNGDVPGIAVDRRVQIPGAGHSDYWGHVQDAPSAFSARQIRNFFNFEGLAPLQIDARQIAGLRVDAKVRPIAKPAFGAAQVNA